MIFNFLNLSYLNNQSTYFGNTYNNKKNESVSNKKLIIRSKTTKPTRPENPQTTQSILQTKKPYFRRTNQPHPPPNSQPKTFLSPPGHQPKTIPTSQFPSSFRKSESDPEIHNPPASGIPLNKFIISAFQQPERNSEIEES